LQRVAQFAVLLPTFATLNRAIQGSVKFLFEFDSALRDIVRIDVGGLAGRLEEIGDSALKTAEDFGVSAIEVLNTTKVFKQAGDTIEQSQERARAAILATQISTLTAAQAVEVFIAASKQFGKEGANSAAVLDKLANVEDVAAVNAADVAEAFRTGGNALAEFAKSIDDSIGLIAALREQTRKSGREIGTFFKTLQTRIFAAGDARSAVEALGITVENLDGTLRPTLDVLNDLAARFDTLTEAQRANAAKAIAGIRQFESLTANRS
jgi:TP901 family phage tail tape measure protein